MKILGLTGSIAMGKSTTGAMLRRAGCAVHDADQAVHRILRQDRAVQGRIEDRFPGTVIGGAVDRARLGQRVFGDPAALRALEAILHPVVGAAAGRFLRIARRAGRAVAVLDIPLLFETGGESRCDAVLVVDAPVWLQRQRALARPGMTGAKLAAIQAQQMPSAEKRKLARFVISSALGRAYAWRCLSRVLRRLRAMPAPRRAHPAYRARVAKATAKRMPLHARNRPRYRNNRPRSRQR